MHNFKELKVWQKSRQLVRDVYTLKLPSEERYGLTSQLRRCCISISSNIAEGSSRPSAKDFVRFLNISLGSAFELETQLILAHDLNLINLEVFEIISKDIVEVQKMLHGLIRFQQNQKV